MNKTSENAYFTGYNLLPHRTAFIWKFSEECCNSWAPIHLRRGVTSLYGDCLQNHASERCSYRYPISESTSSARFSIRERIKSFLSSARADRERKKNW